VTSFRVQPMALQNLLVDVERDTQVIGQTRAIEKAAAIHGMSKASAWRMVKLKSRHPELVDQVMAGDIALSAAWQKAKLIPDESLASRVKPHANVKAVAKKQFQILCRLEGTANAIAATCQDVDVPLALTAAEPGVQKRLERALKEGMAALNEIRREIRAHEAENQARD